MPKYRRIHEPSICLVVSDDLHQTDIKSHPNEPFIQVEAIAEIIMLLQQHVSLKKFKCISHL